MTSMELEFYNAAMSGNIDAFKGKGEQIESMLTPNENTILHVHFTKYIGSVSEAFVEEVLQMCPTLFLKTYVKDETTLHIAARNGHHEIVKKLIDCAKVLSEDINEVGADKKLIRAVHDRKDSALHEAARYGHPKVVEVLIKEEPDHSYFGKNVENETPLYIAVERQYWEVVDTILDNSNSPQYNGPNGRTALHAVVLHGDKEKVSKLLTRNLLAAKEADENGWVPLHLAALCRSLDVVELLVSKDRSTAYMRDNKGRTALHLAALSGDSFIVKKIIEYCPDCCELVDEKGSNALHYSMMAESCHHSFELKQLIQDAPLISNMCNEKDEDGNTPLHLLSHNAPKQYPYCNHPLLERRHPRVDTMACNKYGQTVLDVAVADVPPGLDYENKMLGKLQAIGARLGGRVVDDHLRERKNDRRHDSAIDKKEKQYKPHSLDDSVGGRATTLSVVAILIATVTFAAGFTLPGGLNQYKGTPTLKYNAAFIAFVITDCLSFVLSTSAVLFLFFSSLVVNRIQVLYLSLIWRCAYLTMAAMGFMIIAFGMGIYCVLGASKGFGIVTLLIVLSFFCFFIIVSRKIINYDESYYLPDFDLVRVRDFQLSYSL